MSTVLCLALHTLFLSFDASPYIPFSSTLLVYISQFYLHSLSCILYLGLVDLPFVFCAPHVCVRAAVIARVVDFMSSRVLLMSWKSEQSI